VKVLGCGEVDEALHGVGRPLPSEAADFLDHFSHMFRQEELHTQAAVNLGF
jgi:hypothetical protein